MSASSIRHRWSTALAAGALSAALSFFLVRPGAPEAGAGDDLPAATDGEVRLYGELKQSGHRWTVQVRAVNGAAAPRRCKVTATVSELRDSPMSRVVRAPLTLWTTELALGMEAQGTAETRVNVPASVAARLGGEVQPARARPTKAASPAPGSPRSLQGESVFHSVSLQASCPTDEVVG